MVPASKDALSKVFPLMVILLPDSVAPLNRFSTFLPISI
jgi:Lon protease-like protein